MRSLRQCLQDTYLVRLEVIAHFWDIELTITRQREAASQLTEAMSAPEAIAQAREALPEDQRRALQALLDAEGHMPRRIFARQWGEIRTMGPGRMDRKKPWREPVSPAEGLWYKGLIFHTFEQGPDGAYEVVFIPPELQAHLPSPSAPPPTVDLEPIAAPASVRQIGDAFLDDACTLLAYVQNERLSDKWAERHSAGLLRRLRDADRGRFAFLRHLAGRIGWVYGDDSNRLRLEPDTVTAWLQSSTGQQREALTAAWRDDPTWNELFHIPSIVPEDTGAWMNDPLLARKAILHHLKACAPDEWYGIADFASAIKDITPDFQRPNGDYEAWYIRDALTGKYLTGFESWDAIEGALIRHIITGPLAWLGLVDLGAAASERPPMAFRLTPAGAAFLGLVELAAASEPKSLNLRSDFTVLVPPARRFERFQLARVADWTRTGDVFVYRLTPRAMERARQQGIPIARVLEFLEQVTGASVPRFVEAALTRWEARGAEASLSRRIVLQLSDGDLMDQLMSSPRTGHLVQERAGPTTALVREADLSRIAATLGKLGLLLDVDV